MRIDLDRLMDQGYVIIPEFLSPSRLKSLRKTYEIILDRQKEIWAQERKPGDPPGGIWETARQPRVQLTIQPSLIDKETVDAVEDFWIHDETMDVASQALSIEEPNIHHMSMMCSPVMNHPGGTGWHRDLSPIGTAPLKDLQDDLMENGPRYIQWNAPLYDDDVLWIVPSSHRRFNTKKENDSLREDNTKQIPTGIPVDLKAGDAVIYTHYLLHTGSNYTTKLRRTLHGGHGRMTELKSYEFTQFLAPWAKNIFSRSAEKGEDLLNSVETTLRCVISGDTAGYRKGIEHLEPGIGSKGKNVFTIYLCHAAMFMKIHKNPKFCAPDQAKLFAATSHPLTLNWGPDFSNRFSRKEVDDLWDRFQPLDTLIQSDQDLLPPGFQGDKTSYISDELPSGADMESFIATWATRS